MELIIGMRKGSNWIMLAFNITPRKAELSRKRGKSERKGEKETE